MLVHRENRIECKLSLFLLAIRIYVESKINQYIIFDTMALIIVLTTID